MIDTLAYGLKYAVPDDATSAWGARFIVDQYGSVDMPWDRIDRQGTDAVLKLLDKQLPMTELRDTLRDLLQSRLMNTREDEPFVLYQSGNLVVVANTNGSGGYCYIAAWTTGRPMMAAVRKKLDTGEWAVIVLPDGREVVVDADGRVSLATWPAGTALDMADYQPLE